MACPNLDELQEFARANDVRGAFVRVQWTMPEEDRHEVDRLAIQRIFGAAAEVKLEGRVIPVVRTRAAGISQRGEHRREDRRLGKADRSQSGAAARAVWKPCRRTRPRRSRRTSWNARSRQQERDSWGRRGRFRRLGGDDRRRSGPAGIRRGGLTRKQRNPHSGHHSLKPGIPMRPISLTLKGFRGIRDGSGSRCDRARFRAARRRGPADRDRRQQWPGQDHGHGQHDAFSDHAIARRGRRIGRLFLLRPGVLAGKHQGLGVGAWRRALPVADGVPAEREGRRPRRSCMFGEAIHGSRCDWVTARCPTARSIPTFNASSRF